MSRMLRHYQVVIRTIGPVFIGNGKDIGKKEYVFLSNQQVGIPDIQKLYSELKRRGKGEAFEEFLLYNRSGDLTDWLKRNDISGKDISRLIRYTLDCGDAIIENKRKLQIMIKKHLKAYDYTAALSVAEEIRDDITESAYELLKIADCRVKLNSNEINRINKGKYDIFPIKDGGKQKIFEYALVLQTKIQKKEYADFIRGITPLVVDLLENILKHKCNIRLEDYIIENNGAAKWDMNKLKGTELEEALEEAFKERGGFHGGVVYSEHLTKIICASHQSIETELQQKVEEIVNVEKKTRNIAAHEIVSVTDEWFHDKTGKSFQSIYTVIKYLIRESGINVKEEDWKSYDYMNDMIIKELV